MEVSKFFEEHIKETGECYDAPLVEASRVKKGDSVINGMFAVSADEDGWQVSGHDFNAFMDDAEFQKLFKPAATGKTEDLPAGATAEQVKKGQSMVTQPFSDMDVGVQGTAPVDGWLVALPENDNKKIFMSDTSFRATFNTSAAPANNTAAQGMFRYVPQEDDKPIRYMVLDQETTFDFKAGSYAAPAGHFLYENPDDEDGYTVSPPDVFGEGFTVTKVAIKYEEPSAALQQDMLATKPLISPKNKKNGLG